MKLNLTLKKNPLRSVDKTNFFRARTEPFNV